MGRKARSLVGLEHVVRPAVLRRQLQIRYQGAVRVVDLAPLLVPRTGFAAGAAVHLADGRPRRQIALPDPPVMRMIQIARVRKRHYLRLDRSAGRVLVEPRARLDVVLGRVGCDAAPTGSAIWWRAQTLEEVVGRAVLLNDDDDVLEVRACCASRRRAEPRCGDDQKS